MAWSTGLTKISKLLATAVAATTLIAGAALAQDDVSGELTILNWVGGSELDTMHELQNGFLAKHPGVTIKEVPVTASGEPTGAIRAVLLGGEKIDLMPSAWPSLRNEFVAASLTRPLDDAFAQYGWDKALTPAWKAAGTGPDGKLYGIPYTFGNRSGLWYKVSTFEKAGITPPKTWEDFVATFPKLRAAGINPVEVPAKVWAQQEWWHNFLVRAGGADAMAKLGRHEIAWTDPVVKTAWQKFAEMLKSDCCADTATMLGTEWDVAADNVLKTGTSGYILIGMWLNNRALSDYGLKEGTDYGFVQFPSTGQGHDNAATIDGKEYIAFNGPNPKAADAFLDYVLSAEGANIIAKAGMPSTSANVDLSLYGPVVAESMKSIGPDAEVIQVLADTMPVELALEVHTQLQRLIQDPSDATIDTALAALEAKAQEVY
jgi:ABC-type glycerol-3-phosphate transport system substrate-binding protein